MPDDRKDSGLVSAPTNGTPEQPKAPNPEQDGGIVPTVKSPGPEEGNVDPEDLDIFTLEPVAALKLLCKSVDVLVRMTGDVPPTPPVRSRGPSPNPAQSRLRTATKSDAFVTPKNENYSFDATRQEQIDGVPFAKTPIGSPEARPEEPTSIIAADAQPTYIQHGAIARKFWSKRPPPISLEDYLMRMHKYCPMSTGVYLATWCYVSRLAVHDRVVPVTSRNVHRLLLAGLRVAMKALEDLSWPHGRFAKVGGVSEGELGRLEITFCFLTDFALRVDEATLTREAKSLARTARVGDSVVLDSPVSMEVKLPSELSRSKGGEKRKASSALPSRPAMQAGNGVEMVEQS